jgi:hypothetical protein
VPTIYSGRASVTTSYSGRDPVGRKYLDNGQWVILTTESWAWIIAIDSANTVMTWRTQITTPWWIFKISSSWFFKINSTDMLETQADYPYTLYTWRPII